jgi:hypothetical protein
MRLLLLDAHMLALGSSNDRNFAEDVESVYPPAGLSVKVQATLLELLEGQGLPQQIANLYSTTPDTVIASLQLLNPSVCKAVGEGASHAACAAGRARASSTTGIAEQQLTLRLHHLMTYVCGNCNCTDDILNLSICLQACR